MTVILPISNASPNTRAPIYNSLDSASLQVIALSDPFRVANLVATKVDAYSSNIAVQINQQRSQYSPAMQCMDLEKYIADIRIETSAQGSGVLTLSLIDPGWTLLARNPDTGVSFIDVDDNGYLWPPIEINFPQDVSDATWRLCACTPSTDISQPNLTLTFEDKIVAELREHDQFTDPSCAASRPNETRAEFIRRCVKTASQNPLVKGDVGIRFIPLLPASVFTPADLAQDEETLPTSVTKGSRKNPNKQGGPSNTSQTNSKSAASQSGTTIWIAGGSGGQFKSPNNPTSDVPINPPANPFLDPFAPPT